ncbi:exportin-2-like [Pithys albifrons albifrons]|uniref:exportin-2-like n=1 Tax=Pithys albifrons albifrons TaxID=3385563 RepID=UPI003A5D0FC7
MEHMPPESVDWYRKQVFILLFQRLPSSKPTKLIKRFLCCRPFLLGLFELPEDDTTPDKEHFIDTEDTPGYQTAFSQLAFAGKKEHDPVGQMVNNPRIQLAQSLHKLSTACPGGGRWLGLCIPGLHSAEKKCLCENGLLLRFDNQQNEVCCRQKARSCCVFLFIGTWLL